MPTAHLRPRFDRRRVTVTGRAACSGGVAEICTAPGVSRRDHGHTHHGGSAVHSNRGRRRRPRRPQPPTHLGVAPTSSPSTRSPADMTPSGAWIAPADRSDRCASTAGRRTEGRRHELGEAAPSPGSASSASTSGCQPVGLDEGVVVDESDIAHSVEVTEGEVVGREPVVAGCSGSSARREGLRIASTLPSVDALSTRTISSWSAGHSVAIRCRSERSVCSPPLKFSTTTPTGRRSAGIRWRLLSAPPGLRWHCDPGRRRRLDLDGLVLDGLDEGLEGALAGPGHAGPGEGGHPDRGDRGTDH